MTHAVPIKERLARWCEKTIRADVTEENAASIESWAKPCPRGCGICRDCDRAVFARGVAARLRREAGLV